MTDSYIIKLMFGSRLDPSSPIPLYQQLVTALEARIASGEVRAGAYLPGELELTAEFGVSRITAKRALDELAAAGLVSRARGKGTQVLERVRSIPAAVDGAIEGWLENVGHMQRATSVRVLDVAEVAAPPDIAAALALAPPALAQRAIRVRMLDGAPMSYLVTYLPCDIARGIGASDLGETPLLKLLERAGHRVGEARQRITACSALPEVAEALDLRTGAALLEVRRTVHNTQGRPIQHIRALYRPDLYHIDMSLARVGGRDGTRWSAGRGTDASAREERHA